MQDRLVWQQHEMCLTKWWRWWWWKRRSTRQET